MWESASGRADERRDAAEVEEEEEGEGGRKRPAGEGLLVKDLSSRLVSPCFFSPYTISLQCRLLSFSSCLFVCCVFFFLLIILLVVGVRGFV